MQRYTVYFIWKLLYMFRVVPSPIIRGANNCIYSIWYLSHRYRFLPLSWKRWNWFAVGGVRHSQHSQTKILRLYGNSHLNSMLMYSVRACSGVIVEISRTRRWPYVNESHTPNNQGNLTFICIAYI